MLRSAPPHDVEINTQFFNQHASSVQYQQAGRSQRRWKHDPAKIGVFRREGVPTVADTHRLHENVIGPQTEGQSSSRADFVDKFLKPNADLLKKNTCLIMCCDTEYVLHLFACLEVSKPPLLVLRPPPKPTRPPKKNVPSGPKAVLLCPTIGLSLNQRRVQVVRHSMVLMDHGRCSKRLLPLGGTIAGVYSIGEEGKEAVLGEMALQAELRLVVEVLEWEAAEEEASVPTADGGRLPTTDDGDEDALTQAPETSVPSGLRRSSRPRAPSAKVLALEARPERPTGATKRDLKREYGAINFAGQEARWCKVDWDNEPDPPTGCALFLMNPSEYSPKRKEGAWCVFEGV